jgi:Na+-driven multidrug efflux pump
VVALVRLRGSVSNVLEGHGGDHRPHPASLRRITAPAVPTLVVAMRRAEPLYPLVDTAVVGHLGPGVD